MAVQELNFQGINRAITDYAVTGACEELINLRPTSGGLVPVKDFTVKMQDFPYDAVYVHYAGGTTNYIAILCGADYHVDIIHIAEDGSTISVLRTFYLSEAISSEDIHFAYTGNIVLVSICEEEGSIYRNASFIWDGEVYNPINASVPEIGVTITSSTPISEGFDGEAPASGDSPKVLTDKYTAATNAILENNKWMCVGPTIIALAFKTRDGQTFWTKQWYIYDPIPAIQGRPLYYNESNLWYIIVPNAGNHYVIYGTQVTVTLSRITSLSANSWLDSVEVYASVPVPHYNLESGGLYTRNAKQYPFMELDNQLLYLQRSISLKDLAAEDKSIILKFGGNIQTTEETLQVDAGALTRYGKILSYNARFHYYDSVANVGIAMPSFSFKSGLTLYTSEVYVTYNDGVKDVVVYTGTAELPDSIQSIIASPLGIKEVMVLRPGSGQDYHYVKYNMLPSQTYNYAICFTGPLESGTQTGGRAEKYAEAYAKGVVSSIIRKEPDAINVTEQYNPFVFKVDHSYLAPGRVLDVQPQMVAVRDVTFGDYPLNVFTDRGTYALLQGNGQVLYGNFRSMSNLVSTANSVPTEHGTFFLAAGGLWAVAGSDAILISDALHLGPHKFIRDCAGYQALSASGVGYNVANYVSEVPFEEFTKCAKLSYNRFRDELIISNNFYRYSYVLSLKYRQWFKIDRSLFQDNVGVNIAKLGNKPVVATVTSSLVASVTGQIIKVNYIFNVQRESGLYTRVEVTLDLRDEGDIAELLEAALQETILSGTAVTATVDSDNGTLTAVFSFPATITGGVNGYTESLRGVPPTYSPTMVDSTSNMSISRTTEVIDLSEETDGSVRAHLQSRPFSFNGFGYSHVHRIVDMVRTALAGSDKLIVGLYGSDDLQNWTLLSYGARTALYGGDPLEISQLRTPPAARSWRYYTVCIGGTIPTDTDFGPVLVDYEPVIRRLG